MERREWFQHGDPLVGVLGYIICMGMPGAYVKPHQCASKKFLTGIIAMAHDDDLRLTET